MRRGLKNIPKSIIALICFDLDLYESTKKVFKCYLSHFVKENVLGFNELDDTDCPGETIAWKNEKFRCFI